MNTLPEAISNILHREIKRMHNEIQDVEERVTSIQGRVTSIQENHYAGMVQVHRRIEKLEMDSEDIQEALQRFLDGSLGDRKPDIHNLVSAPQRKSFEAANRRNFKADEEEHEGSVRVRGGQSVELTEALTRIEKLERGLFWMWSYQQSLLHDIDCLRRENGVISKQSKELKELELMVKTPEQSKSPRERMSGIHPQEQPVVHVEDGRASSSTARYQQEGMTLLGGKMDHLRQVELSLSNMEAASRTQAQKAPVLPAKLPQPFVFDLDFRRNKGHWDSGENGILERKTNMDIDICGENQLPTSPRSLKVGKGVTVSLFQPIHEVQRMPNLPKKELDLIQLGALSTGQQLNSRPNEKEDVPSKRDQAVQSCTDDLAHEAVEGSSSNMTEDPERLLADDGGNVASTCVHEEDAAKTHKVLEAYGIDLFVEL